MKLQPELRIRWVFEIYSSEAWLTEQRSVAFLFLDGNVRHLVQSLRRKATGSLKIVHEKYSLKAKNPEETKRYLEEFVDAISHNDAMGGHMDKVCAVRRDAFDVKPFAAMLWPGQAVLGVLLGERVAVATRMCATLASAVRTTRIVSSIHCGYQDNCC